MSSVSHAIQRHVVSDVVTRTETTCSEDEYNETPLILTTSLTWMVFFTSTCGSRDEYLQTCSSLREDDAVLDLETLSAPRPWNMVCCHSSKM